MSLHVQEEKLLEATSLPFAMDTISEDVLKELPVEMST